MKRSWQALLVVVVLGLAAGAAIAGRQALPDNDIRITGATAPEGLGDSSSTSAPAPTTAQPTTAQPTTAAPTTAEPTTAAPANGAASESSVVDASAIEATTTRPPTTTRAPATTEQTEQTDPATTPPAQTSTTAIPAEPDRAVRVVVANATNRAGLAAQTADWLTAVGYSQVLATDARNSRPETALFTRPGFESAALQVAADLGLGQERVQPLPDTAISYNDAAGDVIVALGRDAPG